MKKEIAEKWVADLRTNPPQCKGSLYDGEGHCCLGRLCVVLGATFVEKSENSNYSHYPIYEGTVLYESGLLPQEIQDEAGMITREGSLVEEEDLYSLASLNDKGYNFFQIADIIERNWEKL